jgi:hypothetical protein
MRLTLDLPQVLEAIASYINLQWALREKVKPSQIRFIVDHDGVVEGARIELEAQKLPVAPPPEPTNVSEQAPAPTWAPEVRCASPEARFRVQVVLEQHNYRVRTDDYRTLKEELARRFPRPILCRRCCSRVDRPEAAEQIRRVDSISD